MRDELQGTIYEVVRLKLEGFLSSFCFINPFCIWLLLSSYFGEIESIQHKHKSKIKGKENSTTEYYF